MPTDKPTNIIAQRILAIMDELKEKVNCFSVVTSQVLAVLQSEEGQSIAESLGQDFIKQFMEQIRLEEVYVMANANAEATGLDSEDQREDVKLLQKNSLELSRKMRGHPTMVTELRNLQESRPQAVIQFLKTLADMQELTLKRLTTTVEEERSRQELLEHYRGREAEASKFRQQLEKDLSHMRRECERAQGLRNEILTKLKHELGAVKDSKLERMRALRAHYHQRMIEHHQQFDSKREELQKRINALRDSTTKLKVTSQEEETGQKGKAKRYVTDVDSAIKQYDEKIRDLASNVSVAQEAHKQDLRQLTDLREHFDKVKEERDYMSAEEQITKARMVKFDEERRRKAAASAMVQAFWRGLIQREQFQAMKKKGKKGAAAKKKSKK